jgi:hypothetical protein
LEYKNDDVPKLFTHNMTIPLYFAFFAIVLPLLFVACINERLDDCYLPGGNIYVKIHWDNLVPGENLPTRGMHLQLYPTTGSAAIGYPLSVNGGAFRLTAGHSFTSVCFDYEGMSHLRFRNMNNPLIFEARNEQAYDVYAARIETGRDEPLVHESYPYTFYTTHDIPAFTVPERGTDTIHCNPRNVLHEFTYLLHGVEGVENVASSRGTISGVAGAYRMMSGMASDEPSTVLFRRSRALRNGRFPEGFRWNTTDTLQRVPVAEYGSIPVCPKWFPSGWANPNTGWKGDWVIGAFSVFGLVSPWEIANQLTVECFSRADYHYYASWGYWNGEWEDTVTSQIRGALGYWSGCPDDVEKGSLEAHLLWRKHNGGFDIILANDGRLVIPVDVGLKAPVSGWDGREVPLY